ncbi:hypothetical protein [Vibrio sp. Vb339]|uniref:hypothetical protein n=1 Tax=Vibrio sp. Vb339 TaxID=1192013 RepID=UPI001553615C|nr:hypothetical protein [Vibrio sp. Vb339]
MWTKTTSLIVDGLSANKVWKVWADVNQWHTWQGDIEYATLESEFKKGAVLKFKPKGGPKINIELIEVRESSMFMDLTKFPFAKMYDSHELIEHGNQLEIKSTLKIEGPLSWLWKKLVAESIASGMDHQLSQLIEKSRNV